MFSELAIIFASATIFFFRINAFPLRNWDEAWYAEIAKNMAQGNYSLIVPFWNGQYYFDKPPLYFWLTLPFFKFFGPGEWQARIVSVLSAVLATFLIYLIAKKIFNQRVGIFSIIVFLSLGQVVTRFREGNLDALLVFLFLATFYFFLLSFEKKIFLLISGIFLGLGFLVKGWLLGLFPFCLMFFYLLLTERKFLSRLIPILIFSLIGSGWWFILGFQKFGQRFLSWYLFHPASGYFIPKFDFSLNFLSSLFRDLGFWLLPVLVFLISLKKLKLSQKSILFSFLGTVLLFIFSLQFLSQKFGWYALPAYPLAALLVGYILEKLSRLHLRATLILVVFSLMMQILLLFKIQSLSQDRSEIVASLGKTAKEVIPKEDVLVLDDSDFTSFLFYSDHQKIFTVSASGGDVREWWILKKENLSSFIKNNPRVWIISQNLKNLPIKFSSNQIVASHGGFQFLKTY